jgi:hypothetical protein
MPKTPPFVAERCECAKEWARTGLRLKAIASEASNAAVKRRTIRPLMLRVLKGWKLNIGTRYEITVTFCNEPVYAQFGLWT